MDTKKFEAGRKILKEHRQLIHVSKLNFQPEEIRFIKQVYNYIYDLDYEKVTKQGVPLIFHATAIARTVAEQMVLGPGSIACALLFPYVQENIATLEDIKEKFGHKIYEMTESLIKISGIQTKDASDQVENFRKLLLTLASDVRVILIKIAERLEIMRNLENGDDESKLKIASETSYLYAPLAHRLGLYAIKSELEDFSMRFTHSEKYRFISKNLWNMK